MAHFVPLAECLYDAISDAGRSKPMALPLAIYAHARMTARIAATRAPYAVRLALTVLAFVACVTAASLLCFEACRAPCRAWVGVGCLRA